MKHRLLAASFAAVLVIVSGIAGSFYLAGAQTQDGSSSPHDPAISLDSAATAVESGSLTQLSGSGFDRDSKVSLYLMPAAEANFTNSTWTILQQSSNQSSVERESTSDGNLVNDALDALKGLFGMQPNSANDNNNNSSPTDNDVSMGRLLVVPDEPAANSSAAVECDNEEIAKGDFEDDLAFLSLEAVAGNYTECNITISDKDGIVDSADLGSLLVSTDPDEEYESSIVGTAQTDEGGSFSTSVSISETGSDDEDHYAILGVADNGRHAAVTEAFMIEENGTQAAGTNDGTQTPASNNATDANNNTTNNNQTAGIPAVAPSTENTTGTLGESSSVTNDTSGEAQVQVDEEQVEPGAPLAIQGDGFQPNVPVQILINNVQITNVITNIEGSFNTVVIVPTVVSNGNAEVVVKTEQKNIVKNVDVVKEEDTENHGPSSIRFTAVSANDNDRGLDGAPVTIFDAKTGQLVESDKTPFVVELEKGKYSIFYSDYRDFNFESAQPGKWTDTPGGGSGLLSVREGRNATVTARYDERPAPPAPPAPAKSSLVLRAQDDDGNALQGMFVSVYDAESGNKIEQGFTELKIENLSPGTYPIFFANFGQMAFVSGSPGSWVQTPYGGAGIVTIPNDGTSRNVVITATYERTTNIVEDQFDITAPLDIRGQIFTVTSNQTRPEGPFVMSGTMSLKVESEDPAKASLSAYLVSTREDSNENVNLESQRSRDHDTFQIVDFKPNIAAPTGPNSYIVTGTADLLLNGDMYSNDEEVQVIVRGGEELTPTNVEIQFQGDEKYSAAHRLETLHAVVTEGFQ
ncbi:MAG TPA: hypothetical protein VJP79_06790 [Nitrososphaera sp.]|nr:hypothetical protein [Nitrososphaera sp.]